MTLGMSGSFSEFQLTLVYSTTWGPRPHSLNSHCCLESPEPYSSDLPCTPHLPHIPSVRLRERREEGRGEGTGGGWDWSAASSQVQSWEPLTLMSAPRFQKEEPRDAESGEEGREETDDQGEFS